MDDKIIDGIIGLIPLLILFIVNPSEILLFIALLILYIGDLLIKYKIRNKK